ncbi:MAG: SPW repeat protein [Planctomycetaceae bacterium]
MWPRTVEVMLACWLAISPFIFRYPADEPRLWWHDYIVATLLAVFALASFAHRLRRAHLFELFIAAWLIGYGWMTSSGVHDAPRQNWMCVGLLLLMLAIIPTDCDRPPPAWRRWNRRHGLVGDDLEDPYARG